MKQLIINIPDNKYLAFLDHIKSKFSDIKIEEKKSAFTEEVAEEESVYEIMILSEKSLAKDWLSEEDNRWDEVL